MNEDINKPIALEPRETLDERLFSPSAGRNKDFIAEAFCKLMGNCRNIIEIASGTGEHAIAICKARPDLRYFPSDPDPQSRRSIEAWRCHKNMQAQIAAPVDINSSRNDWIENFDDIDAIVCINMIHIAPFAACEGLFTGAGKLLPAGGRLFLYGPFMQDGQTVPSNLEFDRSLKSRNPDWGVRDIERELVPLACDNGLALTSVRAMPANNHVLIFKKD
jgi:cyclopropane fatty-acyl-phospholipid synthase-like methyltransferase